MSGLSREYIGFRDEGFSKLGVPFGVPIIGIIVYWGTYWGSLI